MLKMFRRRPAAAVSAEGAAAGQARASGNGTAS
jgi:hypothetical protein